MRTGPRRRAIRFTWGFALAVSAGCEAELAGVPEGTLARVGDRVVTPEALEARYSNLGAYAQRRFSAGEGRRALLDGAITQTLLELEAAERGLEGHPAVAWAELEELARLQRLAELERRVPTAEVRKDREAMRAYYEAHIEDFSLPERRAVEMVRFSTLSEADRALARVKAGELPFEELGEVERTPLQPRDDRNRPAFDRLVFESVDEPGALIPLPLLASEAAWVARVSEIEASKPRPFDDPAVQEELVTAVRAPLAAAAEADLLAELAARYEAEAAASQ